MQRVTDNGGEATALPRNTAVVQLTSEQDTVEIRNHFGDTVAVAAYEDGQWKFVAHTR